MIDFQKEIWEGWTVLNFIEELEPELDQIMKACSYIKAFQTLDEMTRYIVSHQPYYKEKIPEIIEYFGDRYGLK